MANSNLLRRYQDIVSQGLYVKDGVDEVAHCALGLAGEAGEVADQIKKSQYEDGELNVTKLLLEMGDVLWYLAWLAQSYGFSLEELALMNIEKLKNGKRSAQYEGVSL